MLNKFLFLSFFSLLLILQPIQSGKADDNLSAKNTTSTKEKEKETIEERIKRKTYSSRMRVIFYSTLFSSFLVIVLILKIKDMEKDTQKIYEYKKSREDNLL